MRKAIAVMAVMCCCSTTSALAQASFAFDSSGISIAVNVPAYPDLVPAPPQAEGHGAQKSGQAQAAHGRNENARAGERRTSTTDEETPCAADPKTAFSVSHPFLAVRHSLFTAPARL